MIRLGFAGFAVAVMLGMAGAAPAPRDAAKTELYYPTTQGSRWTYVEGDVERHLEITEVEVKGDTIVIKITEPNGLFGRHPVPWYTVAVSRAEVKWLGLGGSKLDPPLTMLKLPHSDGSCWETREKINSSHIRGRARAFGAEEVKVPAGSYQALRVEYETVLETGQVSKQSYWFSVGIGVVKLVSDGKVHWELKSFTPGKP